jgi:long-chain acyl-CoA synthetase
MRPNLATFLDDFRLFRRDTAVVRYTGNRRRVTTYKEIATLAGRFAALLTERGIGPGHRVLLWADNSAQWIAAFYGCVLHGVLVVPLDSYGTPDFATKVAADVRPSLVVGDIALLKTLPGEWPKLSFENWLAALPAEKADAVAGLSLDTPLQILFTSGTTGEPKGILHTHGNVLASVGPIEEAAHGYLRYERLVHPLRFLHTLPLSHVFGQTMGLWIPPIFGAEVHFDSSLAAPRLLETIRRERISVLVAIPRVLGLLKSHLEAEYPDLPERVAAAKGISAAKRWWRFRDIHTALGLKFWAFVTGGGALPAPVEQFWNSLGFVLVQGYGMTETAALITLNHPFHVAHGTIGKPLPGREVKLGPDGEVLVRGPMISSATWSGGALHPRREEWLATGDLAETQPTGELRFLGRKSEVIVTGAGINIHPEDLEAALEEEPEVAACAVVRVEAPSGSEPCAVLALRSAPERAAAIVHSANVRLAGFQRIRRWVLWPEPDLPRTSTGKVKRAVITAWLASRNGTMAGPASSFESEDWLLALISRITGEALPGNREVLGPTDDLRLEEDLRLDSLGRVQLLAALEERMGIPLNQEDYATIETLSGLRQWMSHSAEPSHSIVQPETKDIGHTGPGMLQNSASPSSLVETHRPNAPHESKLSSIPTRYVYPRWPWLLPFAWLRSAFVECLLRPLVWLLAAPRVTRPPTLAADAPMLIIANHVTAYDVPLLLSALPRAIRNRTAVAMSGEMLEDFRHARNMQPSWLNPSGPLVWLLITTLFNVFPLPRQRDFQRSFSHAGEALDRGFHVIVFPEGTRSPDGTLARFRPGIGLLVKQSSTAVLPMALQGLGELKLRRRRWFRSETITVCVGQPVRFAADETEVAITAQLHKEVETLLASCQQPRKAI